jgi:hypothetical protein
MVGDKFLVRYGDPLMRWTKATHLVRELHNCHTITL